MAEVIEATAVGSEKLRSRIYPQIRPHFILQNNDKENKSLFL